MKRSWWLAAVAMVVMALPAVADSGPDPARAATGDVTAISVLPGPGSALVIIDVSGAVNVQDFTLNNPDRLVVDVVGASLRAPGVNYDGANRGGILNIRYSQFRPDVVRIVLELDQMKGYELEYVDNTIRIAFAADRGFGAWSSGQMFDGIDDVTPTPVVDQPALLSPVPQQTEQPRITITFDSAHISTVVVNFSEFSGRSILVGEQNSSGSFAVRKSASRVSRSSCLTAAVCSRAQRSLLARPIVL